MRTQTYLGGTLYHITDGAKQLYHFCVPFLIPFVPAITRGDIPRGLREVRRLPKVNVYCILNPANFVFFTYAINKWF